VKRQARVVVLLCLLAMPVSAQTDYAEEAGFGMLAVLTNVVYMPAKVTYAALGALVGGIAYIVTGADLEAAKGIWGPVLGGTYVVSAAMLKGEQPIAFVGPSSESPDNGVAPLAPLEEEPLS